MNRHDFYNILKAHAEKVNGRYTFKVIDLKVACAEIEDAISNSHKHGVSGKQPDYETINATAVDYSDRHREQDRWYRTRFYCEYDFKAGAQWALSQVACADTKGRGNG